MAKPMGVGPEKVKRPKPVGRRARRTSGPPPELDGRPTILTPELQAQIIDAVAGGIPYATAVKLVGVAEATGRLWRQQGEGTHPGRKPTPLLATFVSLLEKAEAQDEATKLIRIGHVAKGGAIISEKRTTHKDGSVTSEVKRASPQWVPDAWVLERTKPEQYGKRERVDLRVQIQKVAQQIAQEMGMTPEEVLAEAELLLKETT